MRTLFIFTALTVVYSSSIAKAGTDTSAVSAFCLHFQMTYVYQYKPAFNALYTGVNSLDNKAETQNSLTSTLYLGTRLWKRCELYINPEIAGGSGLSGAYGLAASTNGETFRVGNPAPTLYLARGFLRQTVALEPGNCHVADGANQVNCNMPAEYIQLLLGKFSLGDIIDNNVYSNAPRTQFMNWAIMNNAAWDYAANVRGYTYCFATQLQLKENYYKIAIATLPNVANGATLNGNLQQEYSLNAETGKTFLLNGNTGNIRLLGYYNYGDMGSYQQAIKNQDSNNVPNIITTRRSGRIKTGICLNADQQISNTVGLFARAGWNDGKTETWCYTEADATVSGGIAINGKQWNRTKDNLGLAVVINGLSKAHRDYLAAGGLGFELGDGKLNYNNEAAAELYYSFQPLYPPLFITFDYQLVLNPGYNQDRGPVQVFSLRVHVEL